MRSTAGTDALNARLNKTYMSRWQICLLVILFFYFSLLILTWNDLEWQHRMQCSIFIVTSCQFMFVLLLVHHMPCVLSSLLMYLAMFYQQVKFRRQVHVTVTISEQKHEEAVQVAYTFMYTCLLYVLCWTPYLLVQIVWISYDNTVTVQILMLCSLYLGMLSSGLKPFIWIYRHEHIRIAASRLFQKQTIGHITPGPSGSDTRPLPSYP